MGASVEHWKLELLFDSPKVHSEGIGFLQQIQRMSEADIYRKLAVLSRHILRSSFTSKRSSPSLPQSRSDT